MMTGLFILFLIALLLAAYGKRRLSLVFIVCGMLLTLLSFWQHATDILKINL